MRNVMRNPILAHEVVPPFQHFWTVYQRFALTRFLWEKKKDKDWDGMEIQVFNEWYSYRPIPFYIDGNWERKAFLERM